MDYMAGEDGVEYMTEGEEKAFADEWFIMSDNGSVFSAGDIARYGAGDWATTSMILERPEKAEGAGPARVVEGPVQDGAISVARLARVQTPKEGEEDNGQHNEIRRPSDTKDNSLGGPRSNAASFSTPTQLSSSTRVPQTLPSTLSKHCPHPPSPRFLSARPLPAKSAPKAIPREESHDEWKHPG